MQKKQLYIYIAIIVACLIGGAFFVWKQYFSAPQSDSVSEVVIPTATAIELSPTPSPELQQARPADSESEADNPTPEATPTPTPLPLEGSDAHLKNDLKKIEHGSELLALLTDEEIIRKTARAIYGLSEGRVVREFRPTISPSGTLLVNKTGEKTAETQEDIYTISRENYARYTPYISLFSAMNNEALIQLYKFYLPALDKAYNELGINDGNFHQTLLKTIDVLLQAPTTEAPLLLVRPSVMYKYSDPQFEKLPAAHKLMLRMGRENSEAFKLELIAFKNRLLKI